ncbi:hypothetical protein WH8501_00270 [Crocosphaera watsonii WH 8501]|uniref:hypothetical protein n=2 Tax=Crocosphaera watsonii TaxID=263511 RepID=UPI0005B2CF86
MGALSRGSPRRRIQGRSMKTTKTVQGKIDPLNFLQLSIFDLPVQDTPTKLRYPNPKKAQKFRDLADRMQSQIDNKLNPAIGQQRPTRRRARIAASIAIGFDL